MTSGRGMRGFRYRLPRSKEWGAVGLAYCTPDTTPGPPCACGFPPLEMTDSSNAGRQ